MPSRRPRAPFLVAFAAYKGGTGKTTVAFNVGLEFARFRAYQVSGRPVVFFDLDPQCRGNEGGKTLGKLFEIGPFNVNKLASASNFEVKVVEYDPDRDVPYSQGSFSDHGLVRKDSNFAPVLLVTPGRKDVIPASPDNLRRILRIARDLLRDYFQDRWPPERERDLERYLSSPPLGIVDTPPMNFESRKLARVLSQVDLVIPVLDPENVTQLVQFCRRDYRTRLAVVNKFPSMNTREAEFLNGVELEEVLRRPSVTLGRDEIIFIPDRNFIRSATALGIPVRARPKSPSGKFREVAWHIQGEWDRRRGVPV